MFVWANFVDIYLRGMRDRSMWSGTEFFFVTSIQFVTCVLRENLFNLFSEEYKTVWYLYLFWTIFVLYKVQLDNKTLYYATKLGPVCSFWKISISSEFCLDWTIPSHWKFQIWFMIWLHNKKLCCTPGRWSFPYWSSSVKGKLSQHGENHWSCYSEWSTGKKTRHLCESEF